MAHASAIVVLHSRFLCTEIWKQCKGLIVISLQMGEAALVERLLLLPPACKVAMQIACEVQTQR